MEAQPHGVLDQLAIALQHRIIIELEIRLRREVPVAFDTHFATVDSQLERVSSLDLANVPVDRLGAVIDATVDQILDEARHVDRRPHTGTLEQCRDFAREHRSARRDRVVQRLHAEPVAARNEPPAGRIVEDKRPHAIEATHALGTPRIVGREDHLGVRAGVERVSVGGQLGPQLPIVVDLAVECDPAASRALHRLTPGGGEIEDLQPPMPEPQRQLLIGEVGVSAHRAIDAPADVPAAVGTAMGQALGGAPQQTCVEPRRTSVGSRPKRHNAAHDHTSAAGTFAAAGGGKIRALHGAESYVYGTVFTRFSGCAAIIARSNSRHPRTARWSSVAALRHLALATVAS